MSRHQAHRTAHHADQHALQHEDPPDLLAPRLRERGDHNFAPSRGHRCGAADIGEESDDLWVVILEDPEIFLGQVGDMVALLVRHHGVNLYQIDCNSKRRHIGVLRK